MGTIRRTKITEQIETVAVPDGYEVCTGCEGKGMVSDYDMGWRSLCHSARLAAKKPCWVCGGDGYTYDFYKKLGPSQESTVPKAKDSNDDDNQGAGLRPTQVSPLDQ